MNFMLVNFGAIKVTDPTEVLIVYRICFMGLLDGSQECRLLLKQQGNVDQLMRFFFFL